MGSNLPKTLIWWRDVPVDVELGLLDFLSDRWQGDIYVVCAHGYEQARNFCNWDKQGISKIHVIIEDQCDTQTIKKIGELYFEEAIHIFSGIRGDHKKHLKQVKKRRRPGSRCVLIAESPSLYGYGLKFKCKQVALKALYYLYHLKYENMFSAFLTLGRETGAIYSSYGWNSNIILPFMYLPRIEHVQPRRNNLESGVKFLYIGRFSDATKGVFLMRKAFEELDDREGWQLDLVGGYGENADEIIQWAHNNAYVNFLGKWDSSDLSQKMSNYDVCLVPSRYDGWNMSPYQSLCSGIGCIVSDNVGSDLIVRNGNFGEVFKANDTQALASVLDKIISNPSIVSEWKANAVRYREKVNQETVGQYFLDCIQFAVEKDGAKPNCPWELK